MVVSSEHITVSTLLTPSVLYHYPNRFSSELPSSSHAVLDSPLPRISVLLDEIIWLSFDSVLYSFGSQLKSWSRGIGTHYIIWNRPFVFSHCIIFPILFLFPLQYPFTFMLLHPCIKPSTCRVINFIFGHQSCHYGAEFDTLTLDFYVYCQSSPSPISNHDNHTHHVNHVKH